MNDSDDEDHNLLISAGRGNQIAFNRLVQKHGPRLHAYINRFTRSSRDSEDLTQETFWRAWKKAPAWTTDGSKVTTWLFTVAGNLATDKWRRNRHKPLSLDEQPGDAFISTDASPEQTHIDRDLLGKVGHFIDALPVRQRQVLLLSVQQQLPMTDIARIMDCSEEAAIQLIRRARRQLRDDYRKL